VLAVIDTHPVQYRAPVYRAVATELGLPVTVVYGSDFSVTGYRDAEFGAEFAWDTDLLSGYPSVFLARTAAGGARSATRVSTRGLARALRAIRPDAVLLVGYSPGFHQAALVAVLRGGWPILLRGETTDHARRRGPLRAWLRSAGLRWLYRRCARLLYVGRRSLAHFRRLGVPDDKLVSSPYCVDTSAFRCGEEDRAALRDATRRALGIAPGERVLLFAGKLSLRKGPDVLVRAVRELPAGLRERVRVVFLGDGALREDLATLAGRAPRVPAEFLGFRNQRALSAYYHAADVLVLPSRRSETWGLVVNEALHHGLPCVASEAVGCVPDLVRRGVTGEVCAPDSPTSLARAIARVEPLVGSREVREQCRAHVSEYTVLRAAEGIATAYRDVVPAARRLERTA
jgi:glycosyltransferase involved in cell wall biosynthesis